MARKSSEEKETKTAKKPVKPAVTKVSPVKAVKKAEAKTVKSTAKTEAVEKAQIKAKKIKKQTPKDTGSVDFQVKNFTDKITTLSDHLKVHAHDFDSRRGLLIMVGKRRRLLNYLKKADAEKYAKVIADLKLKR